VITAVGAIVGLLAGVGVWIAVAGAVGVRVSERQRGPVIVWGDLWWRSGIVVLAGAVTLVITGWPAAAFTAGCAAAVAPMLIGARTRRNAALAKTEALASWAEMLRDTMASHAGVREAIAVSARVAPIPIRAEVRALAVRSERSTLGSALRRFATDVADPVGDLIVAALVIADERQAQKLVELLSEIASSARAQAAMRVRVETGRARTYASSRSLVVITLALAIGLILFSPTFMEPFDDVTGQLVLAFIGLLFAGALWGLVQLGRPVEAPRLLAGVEDGRAH